MKTAAFVSFPLREMDVPFPVPETPLAERPESLQALLALLFPEKKLYYHGCFLKFLFIHREWPVEAGLYPWISEIFFPEGIEKAKELFSAVYPGTKLVFFTGNLPHCFTRHWQNASSLFTPGHALF